MLKTNLAGGSLKRQDLVKRIIFRTFAPDK